jgi:hypothetical protein
MGWWRRGRIELPVQRKNALSLLQAYPAVLSRPAGRREPEHRRNQSMALWPPLSTSEQPHPDLSAPIPRPPGGVRVDVARLVRRPGQTHVRQLLFRHRFSEGVAPRPATQVRRSLSSPFVPEHPHYTTSGQGILYITSKPQARCRRARSICRSASRRAMAWRLSYALRPRTTASSTLAMPRLR